jgi:alpha-L-rhamnosidase
MIRSERAAKILFAVTILLSCATAKTQHACTLLQKSKWITGIVSHPGNPIILNKSFQQDDNIRKATLDITAHGLYEATINNKKVSNAYFTPGWTSYDHRLIYQEYDVTNLLNKGNNEINVTLTGGWYSGAFGHHLKTNNYGEGVALLCALIIQYTDETQDTIRSGELKLPGKGAIELGSGKHVLVF